MPANLLRIPGLNPPALADRDIETRTENVPQYIALPNKLDGLASPGDGCLRRVLLQLRAADWH